MTGYLQFGKQLSECYESQFMLQHCFNDEQISTFKLLPLFMTANKRKLWSVNKASFFVSGGGEDGSEQGKFVF